MCTPEFSPVFIQDQLRAEEGDLGVLRSRLSLVPILTPSPQGHRKEGQGVL